MDKSVRVVGDIHGEPKALAHAVNSAPGHVILLGDLIDGGTNSASVLRRAIKYIRSGKAKLLRSNHDDKLYRHLIGRKVQIGDELSITLKQLEAARDASFLQSKFIELYEAAPHWLKIPNYFLAHGAFHPEMLIYDLLEEVPNRKQRDRLNWLSLYAEGKPNPEGGLPIRTYNWIDDIPRDLTVLVGHDIRSREHPVTISNDVGGKAIFLDTGCGKGGHLSWIDLPEKKIGQFIPKSS